MDYFYHKTFENLSDNNTDEYDTDHHEFDEESVIAPVVRFWTLLIPTIVAITCSAIVLWIILTNAQNRRSLHYRVIVAQLIIGLLYLLVHIPLYLSYLSLDHVWPEAPAICQLWWFFGDGYSDTMRILMAWGTIERHILIFHYRLAATAKKRFLIHYLPLILIILYCPFYYIIVNAFPPCENHYNYEKLLCEYSCLHENPVLILYDTVFNDISTTLLIAIFSISLIFRIIRQNRLNVQIRGRWKKYKKIIIIHITISLIYLFLNLPLMLLIFARFFGLSEKLVEQMEPYFEFLNYFVIIIYPCICLSTISQHFFKERQRRRISPTNMSVGHRLTAK